jgi:hypothetical protein
LISELDVWRAVILMIRQYNDEAEIVAARRADQMLERDDQERRLIPYPPDEVGILSALATIMV